MRKEDSQEIQSYFKGWNHGKTLFWVNGSIFLVTVYIFDWKIVIEAICCQCLSTRIVTWLYQAPIHKPPNIVFVWRKK
ncbi:MAG: YitT family protein [Bacillales bacterium]|nr:YitT family protein [Bacillales bacterium]